MLCILFTVASALFTVASVLLAVVCVLFTVVSDLFTVASALLAVVSDLFFKSKVKLFNFSHNSLKTNLELFAMYYGPLQ